MTRRKKKVLTVYLVLTEHCNLDCVYCDVLGKFKDLRERSHMSWDYAKASLDILNNRLKINPEMRAQLVFFGGEPLLNWSVLVRVYEYLEFLKLAGRVDTMLITNGTLLDHKKVLFLKEHRTYVVVSLDGKEFVNDNVRHTLNGEGSFSAAEKGIDQLMDMMPSEFGISCTLGSHNVMSLSDEVLFLYERFNPRSIGVNMYHYQQDGKSPIEVNDGDLCRSLLGVFEVSRINGIPIHQFLDIFSAFMSHSLNRNYCAACVDKLLFTPRGRVGRCEALMFDNRFTLPVDRLQEINSSTNLDWSNLTPEFEQACADCPARWICPGGCVYDQFIQTASLCGIEPRRCKFFTRLIDEMLGITLDSALLSEGGKDVIIPSQHHFESVLGNLSRESLSVA